MQAAHIGHAALSQWSVLLIQRKANDSKVRVTRFQAWLQLQGTCNMLFSIYVFQAPTNRQND